MNGPSARDGDVTFGEARAGIDLVPRMLRSGAAGGGVVWTMGAASCVVLARTVEDGLVARELLELAREHEARATARMLRMAELHDEVRAEARRIALLIAACGAVMWVWGALV